jgi:hypothetical protein
VRWEPEARLRVLRVSLQLTSIKTTNARGKFAWCGWIFDSPHSTPGIFTEVKFMFV